MNGDISMGVDGIISNAVVERNILHDNGYGGGSAINMDGVQDSEIFNNLTTTKEITLKDGLPFIDIVWGHSTGYNEDSVRFNFTINQDVLMDSILVERPNDSSGTYVISKYIFNKELFVWQNPLGNIIKYYLPPSGFGQQYYPRVQNFTYWFNIYGQKAYGAKTYFHVFYRLNV